MSALRAQTTGATLSGTVTDPTDKVVPAADVIATNTDTGVATRAKTNRDGIYLLPNLQPGHYRLTVDKPGFKQIAVTDLALDVVSRATRNFKLELGAASDTITVEDKGLNVNTADGSVSTVISREFVDGIPLNGRTLQNLLPLAPGIVLDSSPSTAESGYTVNGNRDTGGVNYTVDGISGNLETSIAGTNPDSLQPGLTVLGTTQSLISLDALQEFRISTSSYGVEYGVAPGAQIQLQSRSGTNRFHGSAYDYLRNEDFDANDWFANSNGLPRPPERQNDFGGTFGGPVVIPHLYNGRNKAFFFLSFEDLHLLQPYVTTAQPGPTDAYIASAPAALQPILKAIPRPNGVLLGNGWGRWNGEFSEPSLVRAWGLRNDYELFHSSRLFTRINYSPSDVQSNADARVTDNHQMTVTATLGLITPFTPSLSNDFRSNYSQTRSVSGSRPLPDGYLGVDTSGVAAALAPPSQYVVPGESTAMSVSFSDPSFGGSAAVGYSHQVSELHQWNIVDGLRWQVGRHLLKFGGEWNRHTPIQEPIGYSQSVGFTTLAAIQSEKINGFSIILAKPEKIATIITRAGLYAGDTWKVNQRLSIDYGLRWELPFPAYYDGPYAPLLVTSIANLNAPTVAQARQSWATPLRDFAPRLGVAYMLRDKGNLSTVFRAGGGLFYSTDVPNYGALGYPNSVQISLTGLSYPLTTAQEAPPAIGPGIVTTVTGKGFYGFDPHLATPRVWEWNAAIEQQLGRNQSLTINALGSAGRRLYYEPRYYPTSKAFSNVLFTENGTQSDYNALQVKYDRHLARGLQALVSYTWAHSIDNDSYNNTQNQPEWGNSDFDVRHTFAAAMVYNIPGGKDNRWLKAVTSGWVLSNNIQVHTALPIADLYAAQPTLPDGYQAEQLPNLVPGVPVYLYSPEYAGGKALNFDAFSVPPAGVQGNTARNEFRALGFFQLDTSLQRKFVLGERAGLLRFRLDAFNITNHPNFGWFDVAGLFGPPGWGVPFSMLNDFGSSSALYNSGGPRSLQISLRYEF